MSSSEDSVGIRAWANALPGFTGILKQRYVSLTYPCVFIDTTNACVLMLLNGRLFGCCALLGVTVTALSQSSRLGACCRYSDFMVNEIDASGQVVHLTNKSATQVKLQSLLISNPCRDAASLLQSDKAHTCSAPDRTKHRQIGSQQQASPMW